MKTPYKVGEIVTLEQIKSNGFSYTNSYCCLECYSNGQVWLYLRLKHPDKWEIKQIHCGGY